MNNFVSDSIFESYFKFHQIFFKIIHSIMMMITRKSLLQRSHWLELNSSVSGFFPVGFIVKWNYNNNKKSEIKQLRYCCSQNKYYFFFLLMMISSAFSHFGQYMCVCVWSNFLSFSCIHSMNGYSNHNQTKKYRIQKKKIVYS